MYYCGSRCLHRFISVTEEPYKIAYYAALIRALDESSATEDKDKNTLLGKQLLDDFWKGFQGFLDKLAWREVRLCVSLCFLIPIYLIYLMKSYLMLP